MPPPSEARARRHAAALVAIATMVGQGPFARAEEAIEQTGGPAEAAAAEPGADEAPLAEPFDDATRGCEGVAAEGVALPLPVGAPGEPQAAPVELRRQPERVHVVEEGDTLSEIAVASGVTVAELVEWNPGLAPDRIRTGQRLVIRGSFEVVHRVRRGETLSSIAARFGLEPRQLQDWNPGLRPRRLRVGDEVRILRSRPPSESVGGAACGRLVNGVVLPEHRGYEIRNPARSYGTEETVEQIGAAFDAVLAAFPGSPRTRVHDLSLPEGGPMDDHRSHQSGRDVDIIYYQRRCPGGLCPFRTVEPRELDVARTWTLLEHWLRTGAVELVFIDYALQEPLYEHARAHGATRGQLARWFQYPRGPRDPAGVIRHFPNHRNHLHVRFVCPEGDGECR